MVKNPPANSGDTGPWVGKSHCSRQEMVTCLSILTWKGPWIEEPGGLQSIDWQRVRHNRANTHILFHVQQTFIKK